MAIIEADFTGVKSSAGYLDPGVYRAEVIKADRVDGRNFPGVKFTWCSLEPETLGQCSDDFVSLAPKALWKLKGILEAMGVQVPDAAIRFDTEKLVGKRALIKVINEPWTDAAGEEHPSSKIERVFRATAQLNTQMSESVAAKPVAKDEPLPIDRDDLDFGDADEIPF